MALRPFWEQFDALKDTERRLIIEPVLNKIRQFLLRQYLRGVLGQASPKFSLTDLFYKRRIVLVPLNKGIIGGESARLLGSLIVGMTWTLALSRAKIPPEKRHIVSVYIDELQDYLSLPVSYTHLDLYPDIVPPQIFGGKSGGAAAEEGVEHHASGWAARQNTGLRQLGREHRKVCAGVRGGADMPHIPLCLLYTSRCV